MPFIEIWNRHRNMRSSLTLSEAVPSSPAAVLQSEAKFTSRIQAIVSQQVAERCLQRWAQQRECVRRPRNK